ncbi:MAG: DoxX family protein [Devosia nanyangense]|uniref:DoxX family protein n=1 Tax=Devosia nanyangense TaxID=1228055 RepID=A0A933L2S4_9HYPH|nr:DoxX family protein [Devosia nanyangense]
MQVLTTMTFWLWAAQIALAILYGMAGVMKSTQPIPKLAGMIVWPGDVPEGFVRFIGISEALAALGMVLPIATGILPWLTPLAAICLSLIQVLAIAFHARRGETSKTLPMNLAFLALSLFVAVALWPLFGKLGG